MPESVFLSQGSRNRYLRFVDPLGRALGRLGVHPNLLSLCGLLLSALAGLVYSTGAFFWAAWVVVLAGTCDVLDGQVARQSGKASRFGAFYDSTLDRFSEALVFLGMAWHYSGGAGLGGMEGGSLERGAHPVAVALIILAIAGSFMVSYTRARAEGLGVSCKVGWMQRPERITLLIIGSLLSELPVVGGWVMMLTLVLLAVLSNFTALQRMAHVRKALAERRPAS